MTPGIVSRSPDVMGGTAVFTRTRVPVQTLLDYLEAGDSIDDFLEGFPTVTREQVIAFLEDAKDRAIAAAEFDVFLTVDRNLSFQQPAFAPDRERWASQQVGE